jgi:hypothetical protein
LLIVKHNGSTRLRLVLVIYHHGLMPQLFLMQLLHAPKIVFNLMKRTFKVELLERMLIWLLKDSQKHKVGVELKIVLVLGLLVKFKDLQVKPKNRWLLAGWKKLKELKVLKIVRLLIPQL